MTSNELTRTRRTVATRMALSKITIPHLYVTREIVMENVLAAEREARCGLTARLVHALYAALRAHPTLNGVWVDDNPRYEAEVNIGVAVATERGLVAPTLAGAGDLGPEEIGERLAGLVARARSHQLRVADLTPATFTISNVGMYDVMSALSIIVPPQLAILCTGKIVERVVANDGQIEVRPVMVASVSADHRGVDGEAACGFLGDFGRVLEQE